MPTPQKPHVQESETSRTDQGSASKEAELLKTCIWEKLSTDVPVGPMLTLLLCFSLSRSFVFLLRCRFNRNLGSSKSLFNQIERKAHIWFWGSATEAVCRMT